LFYSALVVGTIGLACPVGIYPSGQLYS